MDHMASNPMMLQALNCCTAEPGKNPLVPYQRVLKITNPELSLIPVSIASTPRVVEVPVAPSRACASTFIPQGAITLPIDPGSLVGKAQFQQFSVCINTFGTMEFDQQKSIRPSLNQTHWVRSIRFSDDCHSYNVQLKLQPSYRIYPKAERHGPMPKLILQAVRPIEIDQELLLWFSEDILAMLQVVFLNPSNIQGQKRYVCTRCYASYEAPNPLKLHITLNCFKSPISYLWERLADLMEAHDTSSNIQDTFEFRLLSPEKVVHLNKSNADQKANGVLDLSISSSLKNNNQQSSAFKPFKKEAQGLKLPASHTIQEIPTFWPMDFEQNVVQFHQHLMQSPALNNPQVSFSDDAQIESLVSSLGKAKQGHICLYCGKCYSRKYGLKIHIRTHTGYKPLKCKFCERPFGDPSNLNKHVRLHAEGNTPYKCDLCGKILVRRRDLDRHLKSRHLSDIHPGENIIPDSSSNNSDVPDISEITEVHMSDVYDLNDSESIRKDCEHLGEINKNSEIDDNEVIEVIDEKDFKDLKMVIKESVNIG